MTASRKLSALTTYIKLFRTKARHIYWLDLLSLSPETHHLSGDVINIPADLLKDKTVERIAVNCSTITGPLRLEIHPKAFRSSIQYIGHFEVTGCDLSQLNFNFLSDTTRLMSLSISRSVHFRGFPPLPFFSRLKSLRIYECQDFQHWNEISVRFPNLESLFLDGTLLGDRSVNQLVSSINNWKRHTAATEFMEKPTHPHSGSHFVFQKIELR